MKTENNIFLNFDLRWTQNKSFNWNIGELQQKERAKNNLLNIFPKIA